LPQYLATQPGTLRLIRIGWGVLAYEPLGRRLIILQARNHQMNVAWNAIPLLVLDVWEHAYYLKYKNARADYVKAF
jgi:Fe-Mn family superoxide dismutase